jgi:Fe2+ transport system protein FeoA
VRLDRVRVGGAAVIRGFTGLDEARTVRLAELGLRPGSRVTVRSRTSGGGRVVSIGDDRVAVAAAVLAGIEADPVDEATTVDAVPASERGEG